MSRSKVQLDIQSVHADDIGEVIGIFHGSPIREWYPTSAAVREINETERRLAIARARKELA